EPQPTVAENPAPQPWTRRPRPGFPGSPPPVVSPGIARGVAPSYYGTAAYVRLDTTKIHPEIDDWHFCGYGSRRETAPLTMRNPLAVNEQREAPEPVGVAAWNDQGAASKAAGEILTEAAGIEIPTADF